MGDSPLAMFKALHQKVWVAKDGLILVDQETGAQYLDLRDLEEEVILVRSEYLELWNFVHEKHTLRTSGMRQGKMWGGLVITGQPGIGKTLFLKYALLRALKDHIPVVYCNNTTRLFIFDGDGCHPLSLQSETFPLPKGALCLVDSHSDLIQPSCEFFHAANLSYVVQAVSPKPKCWRKWSKQQRAPKWVMGLWTRDEMEKLEKIRRYLNPTTLAEQSATSSTHYTPLELFDLIGPSLRNCYHYSLMTTKTPGGPEVDVDYGSPSALFTSAGAFWEMIGYGHVPPSAYETQFHWYLFGTNLNPNPTQDDPRFHYTIPTRYLRRRIADHFRKMREDEQAALLTRFAPLPQVAGIFYESIVLDILQDAHEFLPCHLYGDTESPSFRLGPGLSFSPYQVDPKVGAITLVDDDCIFVPLVGFRSLDALVISKNKTRVTMLQITISKKHKLSQSDIRMVINSLKENLPNNKTIMWSVLLVSSDDRGQNIVNELQKNFKGLGSNYPVVRLGWLTVGPEVPKYSAILAFQTELERNDPANDEVDAELTDDDADKLDSEASRPSGKGKKRTSTDFTSIEKRICIHKPTF